MRNTKIIIISVYLILFGLLFVPISTSQAIQDNSERNKFEELKVILDGKNVSILGDSISTFIGYSNDGNANKTTYNNKVYYKGNNEIANVNDTWWKQVIDRVEVSLLVNNSWSSDKVVSRGQDRSEQLHNNEGVNPDIVFVYIGVNDFNSKSVDANEFENAYDRMISNIVNKYGKADIFLINFVPNNKNVDSYELTIYNNIISHIATKYKCTLVDLYGKSGITEDNKSEYTVDEGALHPNKKGMSAIANVVVDSLISKYVED